MEVDHISQEELEDRQKWLLMNSQARRLQKAFRGFYVTKFQVLKNLRVYRIRGLLPGFLEIKRGGVCKHAAHVISHFMLCFKEFFRFKCLARAAIEKIEYVQRKWRAQMANYNLMLGAIRSMWNEYVERQLMELFPPAKRGRLTKKQMRTFTIWESLLSKEVREKPLKDYLASRIRDFLSKLRDYNTKAGITLDGGRSTLKRFASILFSPKAGNSPKNSEPQFIEQPVQKKNVISGKAGKKGGVKGLGKKGMTKKGRDQTKGLTTAETDAIREVAKEEEVEVLVRPQFSYIPTEDYIESMIEGVIKELKRSDTPGRASKKRNSVIENAAHTERAETHEEDIAS